MKTNVYKIFNNELVWQHEINCDIEKITTIYPQFKTGYYFSKDKFNYPILENGIVRDMEREEKILLRNELDLLLDGEIVQDNTIIIIPCPASLYTKVWKSPNWIEGATLEEVKEIKRIELKTERDKETYEPIEYNSNLFDADGISRGKIFQAQQTEVGAVNSINWITHDNKIVLLSNEDLSEIIKAISNREQVLYNKFAEKYTIVLNSSDIDEIKSIQL